MNRFLFLFFTLLLNAPLLRGQAVPEGAHWAVPFKGANTIVITAPDTSAIAWRQMADLLLQKGFTLDRTDPTLHTLSTAPRQTSRLAVRYTISAFVRGNQIAISGQLNIYNLSPNYEAVQFRGMSGSPMMVAWNDLQAVASAYPAGRLHYEKR